MCVILLVCCTDLCLHMIASIGNVIVEWFNYIEISGKCFCVGYILICAFSNIHHYFNANFCEHILDDCVPYNIPKH